MTLLARTKARTTSADEVSFHTVSTVFHIFSIEASVLLYNCSWAECRWDMDGNKDRSSTFVYGPMKGSRYVVIVTMACVKVSHVVYNTR